MKTALEISALMMAAAVSGAANAYESGDWIVRTGAVVTDPQEDSSSLNLAGTGNLQGTGVEVDSDTQLLLNFTYMATPHLGVELLAATPFEHEVRTTGLAGLGLGLSDVEVGSVKHLPPTLCLLWYPMSSSSRFQPFIGGGFNYTLIFEEDLSRQAATALGASDLDLDNSSGFAFRAGVDVLLTDRWSIHAGAYNIDISTRATLDTALGRVKTDVEIDPWVYTVGIGYKF